MTPPVFETLKDRPEVIAALGTNPMRVYEFGLAPDNVQDPYCVWQTQSGAPNNFLGGLPNTDLFGVQFDVYGTTAESVKNAAKAIRDAIEPRHHVTAWLGGSRDSQTKRYRLTFTSDWWVNR